MKSHRLRREKKGPVALLAARIPLARERRGVARTPQTRR